MKQKLTTIQSKNPGIINKGKKQNEILTQINATIAERNRILPKWEKLFSENPEDIHQQLKKTIKEFKKSMERHNWFLSGKNAA